MAQSPREPMGDARRRKLAGFCRMLCLYFDRDQLTRDGIARMAADLGDPELSGPDRERLMDTLESWLFDGDNN